MIERALGFYSETSELIKKHLRHHPEENSELFKQLMLEEVLLGYRLCKNRQLHEGKMLGYFERVVESLASGPQRNVELMAKIARELIDTFKFKLSDIL
jgi:hypothetical protein